jgi:hypothetical protein
MHTYDLIGIDLSAVSLKKGLIVASNEIIASVNRTVELL